MKEVVIRNFKERRLEILVPAFKGIFASVSTILVLTTNPYGWTIGALTFISGLIIASLSIIGAIGFTIYQFMKRPVPIKNSITVN